MNLPTSEELKRLPPDGRPKYNRLVFEKSPYLLQHAANPVDWFPWCEEAFEKAKNEDKPVFLSIGYATCHWCHVMEHESFEDSAVAALMNENFVCIKVDREERPDIDNIYMSVTQAMTGGGGWPMTVIMTWNKKPFFTGTYFPKQSNYGRPGMLELIPSIADAWKNRRTEVLASADNIAAFVHQSAHEKSGEALSDSVLAKAYGMLKSQFDPQHAGFGNAPKFPTAHNLSYLLRYWKRSGDSEALRMVEKTLTAMRMGGIYDHVGFGFHRYATDAKWFLPHFEKMLYDQAMLAIAYIEAYQATKKDYYKKTAQEIFTYVLRDLTDAGGGFYSAEDADSEGKEGKFYLWTSGELETLLGKTDGEFVARAFNAAMDGNYYEESTREYTGENILHLTKDADVLAYEAGLSEEEFLKRSESLRQKLFDAREKRVHPFKDDKILTDWNGLMIAALSKGAQAFNEPKYSEAAGRAADFVLTKLRDKSGRLLKRARQGEAGLPAHADDYAFMIWGLLELYEATFDLKYLQSAMDLNQKMIEHFWDKENGGFYFTADDGEALIARMKEIYDGAIPSANSVAALNLVRLSRITGKEEFANMAAQIGKAFSKNISQMPMGHAQFLIAMDFAFGPSYEIVIAGGAHGSDTQAMLNALHQEFIPNKIVLLKTGEAGLELIAPFTESQTQKNNKATAYVCLNYACKAPTNDLKEMMDLLK